jgi:hypothetical protein
VPPNQDGEMTFEQKKAFIEKMMEHADSVEAFQFAVLHLGCVDPRVVKEIKDEEKEVTIYDIEGVDRDFLMSQILEFSDVIGSKSSEVERTRAKRRRTAPGKDSGDVRSASTPTSEPVDGGGDV